MRRSSVLIGTALLLLLIVTGVLWWRHNESNKSVSPSNQTTSRTSPNTDKIVDHVIVIVEENHSYEDLIGNRQAPYLNSLVKHGALATNYHAGDHPSLPNYIVMTSGQPSGIRSDCSPSATCATQVTSIVDDLERAGLSWKAYLESMPAPCTKKNDGSYAVRHNPFVYYESIGQNMPQCQQHDVPFTEFFDDISRSSTTPAFAFISPNVCNDMHDCSVATGEKWLQKVVPKILAAPAFTTQNSLLVITWDEDDHNSDNHIVTLFLGPAAKTGTTSARRYDHYDLYQTLGRVLGVKPSQNNGMVMTDLLNN